jgi:hypothetical protein
MVRNAVTASTFNLTDMEQGHLYTLAITAASGLNAAGLVLQFQQPGDTVWYNMPAVGNISCTDTVIIHEYSCFTPIMRLSFANTPPTYNVSNIVRAVAYF